MKQESNTPPDVNDVNACCSTGCSGLAPSANPTANGGGRGRLFRIATMDCSAEEAEIRRALEPLDGIRSLGFQLGARTLSIDAIESVYPLALAAIRNAGFDPQPVTSTADSPGAPTTAGRFGADDQHPIQGRG
mgnify:FL=1